MGLCHDMFHLSDICHKPVFFLCFSKITDAAIVWGPFLVALCVQESCLLVNVEKPPEFRNLIVGNLAC